MKEPKKKWILQGWGIKGGKWAGVSLLSFLGMLMALGLNRKYDIDTPHAIWILMVIGVLGGMMMYEGGDFWKGPPPG